MRFVYALFCFVVFSPFAFANPKLTTRSCDMDTYRNVIAACFTGRAIGAVNLPYNTNFGTYAGDYTENWNFGTYDSDYLGTAFSPTGKTFDPSESILPPYNWGAVGQICDVTYDPLTHDACVTDVAAKLNDKTLNALASPDQFYWRSHGHNCHDAVEDVGFCLNRAGDAMAADCGIEAKAIVWDSIEDINKALGDVYHSQLLVKRIVEDPATNNQSQEVCLAESQIKNESGLFSDGCCTGDLSIFDGGTSDQFAQAFGGCDQVFTWGPYPHVYSIDTFRQQRKTGDLDMSDGYNRDAGKLAAKGKPIFSTKLSPPVPKIVSAAYDKNGVALAVNVK